MNIPKTAGPRLALRALDTIRSTGVRYSPRNQKSDGAITQIGKLREARLRERIRAIQFVIHTEEVYEPILGPYQTASMLSDEAGA